ncbi:MAG: hypothetical protein CME06_00335, partial [Gemmatimonadetes bacterium]|nr:hypothetical protein [Gemmatimonadota bacterium]
MRRGGWQATLVEGPWWPDLRPLSWTRPVWALRCGATTILERVEALLGRPVALIGRKDVGACLPIPVGRDAWRPGPSLFLDARWLPATGAWRDHADGAGDLLLESADGRVVGAYVTDPPADAAERLRGGEEIGGLAGPAAKPMAVQGRLIDRAWLPMLAVAEEIERDFGPWCRARPSARPEQGPGTHFAGERFWWGKGASCEGGAFLDARSGPVLVAEGAVIGAGSIVKGPAFIGPRSELHAARLEGGVSLGPRCKIGGEVQCTVVQGFSNKVHDGFLGHAHLGSWVNLGATTTNSDLKNTYGEIAVDLGEGRMATGSTKIGCLLGDHVKTAIGTLLYTGTVVDPGSTLFAGAPVSG